MTRWHSDALAAPHTQREMGEGAGDKPCPRRGALQEAIEEVKRQSDDTFGDITEGDLEHITSSDEEEDAILCAAIATILNAVVKGELKYE